MSKTIYKPNITSGGKAIPLGRNIYYMKGRKHKDGGIDLGLDNKNGLEVEDGEIMKINKNEIKVLSSVPFLNGESPAQKVLKGDNIEKVFKQQENYKDKHNLNDDGTMKTLRKKAKVGIKQNNTDKLTRQQNRQEKFDNFVSSGGADIVSDAIGGVANLAGSLASYFVNNKTLNEMEYIPTPVAYKPKKLKTKININSQLDRMRESIAKYNTTIDNNTSSSRVALARKQNANNNYINQYNDLLARKENAETELINQDALNQQQVNMKNIDSYNQYQKEKTMFENTIREQKSENAVNLANNINLGIQDTLTRLDRREALNQNIKAMLLGNPNVSPQMLKDMGIKGITKSMINNWNKNNKKVIK